MDIELFDANFPCPNDYEQRAKTKGTHRNGLSTHGHDQREPRTPNLSYDEYSKWLTNIRHPHYDDMTIHKIVGYGVKDYRTVDYRVGIYL